MRVRQKDEDLTRRARDFREPQVERQTRFRVREVDPAHIPSPVPEKKSYVTNITFKPHEEKAADGK